MAETCFLLARTSADRKRGISIFLVPMDTPWHRRAQHPQPDRRGRHPRGLLRQRRGSRRCARLGEEGEAWEIISFSLRNERLGIPRYAFARRALDRAVSILKDRGQFKGEAVQGPRRPKTAAACEASRLMAYALIDQRVRGIPIEAEASAARVATVNAERSVGEFVVEYLPETLADGDPLLKAHHQRAIVAGIASGAAEIQLNIVAGDVLKLPREAR